MNVPRPLNEILCVPQLTIIQLLFLVAIANTISCRTFATKPNLQSAENIQQSYKAYKDKIFEMTCSCVSSISKIWNRNGMWPSLLVLLSFSRSSLHEAQYNVIYGQTKGFVKGEEFCWLFCDIFLWILFFQTKSICQLISALSAYEKWSLTACLLTICNQLGA